MDAMKSKMAEGLGKPKKAAKSGADHEKKEMEHVGKIEKAAKKLREMHIRKSANGGYIVKNDHEMSEDKMGSMAPAEEHAYADKAGMMAHVDSNWADERSDKEAMAGGAEKPGGESVEE